jgi:hypothetical protein
MMMPAGVNTKTFNEVAHITLIFNFALVLTTTLLHLLGTILHVTVYIRHPSVPDCTTLYTFTYQR